MLIWIFFIILLNEKNFVVLDCGCNKFERTPERGNKQSYFGQDKQHCSNLKDNSNIIENDENEDNMFFIPGGIYTIGTNQPVFHIDQESPEKIIKINDFYMDKYEVSNKDFKKFIDRKNFITDAEKFNDSFVFYDLLSQDLVELYKDFRVVRAPWWYRVNLTNWKHPHGPNSNIDLLDLWNHPVVHVSWKDAVAYCSSLNKKIPSEAEWEVACRGGKKGKLYPWGNKLNPRDQHWANIWQGNFPSENIELDGFKYTNPVDKFPQNDYEMYNIVGNVWEWTSDLWDVNDKSESPNRVKKGGSYLCHKSYCYRYRCAARSQNTEDSSASNLGFRCAKDAH